MNIKWTEFNPPEKQRTYVWILPSGETHEVTFRNVKRIEFRDSGTHRIETEDGDKVFVKDGWDYVILEIDEWTV